MTIMEEEKRTKVMELLLRLKKLNRVYQLCETEDQRGRLLSASVGLQKDLVAEGYEKSFVETLLICGKEFLETLYPADKGKDIPAEYEDLKVIFS